MSDYDSIEEIDINRDGAGMRIGIVAARFNADVSDGLLAGCTEELLKLGVIPIINENDAVSVTELKFGDNDRLAARVAQMISAEIEVLTRLLSDDFGLTITTSAVKGGRHFSKLSDLFDDVVTGRVAAGLHFRNSCGCRFLRR